MTLTTDAEQGPSRLVLGHPVIDSDSHYTDLAPVFREQFLDGVGRIAGAGLRDELASAPSLRGYLLERTTAMGQAFGSRKWETESAQERRQNATLLPGWAPPHSNPLDRATSLIPALRSERLEEIGIDFSVLYPSSALFFPHIDPAELRQVACRALNLMNAETYRPFQRQMTPAAVIPMTTPEEAVAELEYAVTELGLKVAMIGYVARPLGDADGPDRFASGFRLDAFGIDSDHDYDPFWAKAAELKVPLVSHSTACGIGFRRSPTNYTFNHAGNFAEASDILCRSLFLGGVTRRFPTLKFQFLECGVGWACMLYAELVHRWEKRNIGAIRAHVEAAKAAAPELLRLLREHSDPSVRDKIDGIPDAIGSQLGGGDAIDDFAAAGIESVADIEELFVPRFFFGCEADDPMTAWAFNTATNPGGARLRAVLGSDMGHWDVPDIRHIVPEARTMVEHGLIDENNFRRFTFEHPYEFFAGVKPDFFTGTNVGTFLGSRARSSE